MAIVFDGKKQALLREKRLAAQVKAFQKKRGFTPKLVNIIVGNNPASQLYVQLKQKASQRVGIEYEKKHFSASTSSVSMYRYIDKLNQDDRVTGIMIQMPLPKEFAIRNSQFAILDSIEPSKDVDCLTPENFGLLVMGQPRFLPATVAAIMEIIQAQLRPEVLPQTIPRGDQVVVVGASNIVGKPLALHLSNLGATVTLCRSKTKDLAKFTREADILVSATGVPKLIKAEMVKDGAVVIDVGAPRGDVDFAKVSQKASLITPVPGGVGPLTVVCLLENVLQAAKT